MRPVLLFILEKRIAQSNTEASLEEGFHPSRGTCRLLEKLFEAVSISVQILQSTQYQDQLQSLMDYDTSAIFSSAVIIAVARCLGFKVGNRDRSDLNWCLQALTDLGVQGNVAAFKRGVELHDLVALLDLLRNSSLDQRDTVSGSSVHQSDLLDSDYGESQPSAPLSDMMQEQFLSNLMSDEYAIQDFEGVLAQLQDSAELFVPVY